MARRRPLSPTGFVSPWSRTSGSSPLGKNSLPREAISKKPSSSGSGTPRARIHGIMPWMFQMSEELTVA